MAEEKIKSENVSYCPDHGVHCYQLSELHVWNGKMEQKLKELDRKLDSWQKWLIVTLAAVLVNLVSTWLKGIV